ncbi:MAG: glutamyl-tRNA reductase [Firmicutes bacterium]|nr:glutamyl-tRNA reductase [Bacillota bacterium]
MSVWMVGVDHNKADLDVRGLFSFTKKKMAAAYAAFFQELDGLSGCVILSTCNRLEWWLSVSDDAAFSPADALCSFLQLDPAVYGAYLIERRQEEAVDHLFRLAAGLESRIVGEDQILTQVGEALSFARAAYATDHTLEVLFRHAVTAGKRVKTETDLSTADRSVIHTALEMLERQGLTVNGRKCLVIGNGMMGRLSAQALLDAGADVTVTVRHYISGIVDIPRGCHRIDYQERYGLLPGCELVVSATSSPNHTLTAAELARVTPEQPICLVDLAVPRDIEPDCGRLPGFTLYDIDAFRIDLRSEKLRRNVARAEAILAEEKEDFYNWYDGRDLVPRIQTLKETAARYVNAGMSSAYRRRPELTEHRDELEQAVDQASRRMMNRLLFGMRSRLPDSVFSECLQAMEQVFADEHEKA